MEEPTSTSLDLTPLPLHSEASQPYRILSSAAMEIVKSPITFACCHLHLCQNVCSVKIASSVLLSSSHVPNGTSWHICLQAEKAIDQEVAAAQRSFVGSLCKGVYILLISLDVSTFHVPILKIELMARSAWSFSVEGRQLPPCVEAESGASPYLFGR